MENNPCKHEWEEVYYGTQCKRCGLFYPDGCAPWDYDEEELEGREKNPEDWQDERLGVDD